MADRSHAPTWTDQDFESLSWHDNRVQGIQIRNPRDGYDFDLVLEIDHILEWVQAPGGRYQFLVAPASLIFHNVGKLAIDVCLSNREDLAIDRIDRTAPPDEGNHTDPGSTSVWRIAMHSFACRDNSICFEATGFTQRLTGRAVGPIDSQFLEEDERRPLSDGTGDP